MTLRTGTLAGIIMLLTTNRASASPEATKKAKEFVDTYTALIRPLEVAANRAWWDANITGKDEDFKRKEDAQNKIDAALADKTAFAQVKAIKEGGGIDDPILKRAIDIIYLAYLEKQLDADLLQ